MIIVAEYKSRDCGVGIKILSCIKKNAILNLELGNFRKSNFVNCILCCMTHKANTTHEGIGQRKTLSDLMVKKRHWISMHKMLKNAGVNMQSCQINSVSFNQGANKNKIQFERVFIKFHVMSLIGKNGFVSVSKYPRTI